VTAGDIGVGISTSINNNKKDTAIGGFLTATVLDSPPTNINKLVRLAFMVEI